jgi:hypothetical protein
MNNTRSAILSVLITVALLPYPTASVCYAQRPTDAISVTSACPLLDGTDLAQASTLIQSLSDLVHNPSQLSTAPATDRYIVDNLSRTPRALLLAYPDVDIVRLRNSLAEDLNTLLQQPRVLFSHGNGLGTFPLASDTRTLIRQHPTGDALVDLNRRILEDRYSDITRCPRTPVGHGGTTEGGNNGSHNNTGEIVAGVAAIAILGAILSHPHHSHDESKSLMDDGPQIAQYTPTSFAIHGFVSGGWPLYVDYELDQPATVNASVAVDGGSNPFTTTLTGDAGRHEAKLTLPEEFGRGGMPGTIVLAMEEPGTAGPAPIHLHLLGISCGPGAVGSDGIQDAKFAQDSISLASHDPASYMFGCIYPFQTVVTEIVRISGNTSKTTAVVVSKNKLFNRSSVPILPQMVGPDDSTEWAGSDQKHHKSLGMHELEVFAWENSASPKSWSYAASENFLQVLN